MAARHLGLLLIAALYGALVFSYATGIPRWNAPDEPAHFNFIRHIAERGELPVLAFGDFDPEYLDRLKASRFPPSAPIDTIRYESHQPPLYYLLGAAIYHASSPLGLAGQVVALRLFSALLGLLTIGLAYSTLRQIFPTMAWPALGVAAFVAFLPMHLAVNAAIGNDPLADLMVTLVLCEAVRMVTRRGRPGGASGPGWQRAITSPHCRLGFWLGLTLLTKTTAYPALPVAAIAVLIASRNDHARFRQALPRLAGVGLIALTIGGWWIARNALTYGLADPFALQRQYQVAVASGQPLTGAITWDTVRQFATITFQSFWGQFGWMGVPMDERVYAALGALSLAAALGLSLSALERWLSRGGKGPVALARGRSVAAAEEDRPRAHAYLLLALTVLLVFAEMAQYNFSSFFQPQGRYLFPALVAIATGFVLGLRALVPARHAPGVLVTILGALAVLDFFVLRSWIVPALGGNL